MVELEEWIAITISYSLIDNNWRVVTVSDPPGREAKPHKHGVVDPPFDNKPNESEVQVKSPRSQAGTDA
jgi:hypothetical protein